MRKDLIEYGEISRNPINQNTLVKHWLMINSAIRYNRNYKVVYFNGYYYEIQDYRITKYGNNKYISELKFVRVL